MVGRFTPKARHSPYSQRLISKKFTEPKYMFIPTPLISSPPLSLQPARRTAMAGGPTGVIDRVDIIPISWAVYDTESNSEARSSLSCGFKIVYLAFHLVTSSIKYMSTSLCSSNGDSMTVLYSSHIAQKPAPISLMII
jgi:hypothetical protein